MTELPENFLRMCELLKISAAEVVLTDEDTWWWIFRSATYSGSTAVVILARKLMDIEPFETLADEFIVEFLSDSA